MPGRCSHIYRARSILAESLGFEPKVGYKPTHDFQSCALHEQVFANCRSIREVIGVEVGSEGKRSVTKTPLHELHGFAAENGGSRHRVAQAVEGHRRQRKPLRNAVMV